MPLLLLLLISATTLIYADYQDELFKFSDGCMRLARVLPSQFSQGADYFTATLKNGKQITIMYGNIVDQKVDAIVNAANHDLVYGGGVAGAIYDKAAPESERQQKFLHDLYPIQKPNGYRCKTGTACLTLAFGGLRENNIRFVVEAVGPICGDPGNESHPSLPLIQSAYKGVFNEIDVFNMAVRIETGFNEGFLKKIIDEINKSNDSKKFYYADWLYSALKHIKSVAMPLLSAAIFGCNAKVSCDYAIDESINALESSFSLEKVVIMIYSGVPIEESLYGYAVNTLTKKAAGR